GRRGPRRRTGRAAAGRPLFMVDIAVPRDIDPAIDELNLLLPMLGAAAIGNAFPLPKNNNATTE
ncbi:hypothetical protein, partial [Bacillus mobilis]|uniref:hypothetical protein n=1 Tax=Bacillus mobilis TaxID=2026190 RepID=UPI00366D3639